MNTDNKEILKAFQIFTVIVAVVGVSKAIYAAGEYVGGAIDRNTLAIRSSNEILRAQLAISDTLECVVLEQHSWLTKAHNAVEDGDENEDLAEPADG